MELEQIIQKMAEIRASKNVELRIYANEHPERTVTLAEVADVVDQALIEVSQALMDALSAEDRDEQAERERWYASYVEEHPYDWWQGDITDDYPLPRTSTSASWYKDAPK